MRCLVTGASGFLGSHLVRKLLEEGYPVLAVVRETSDLWRLKGLQDKVSIATASLNTIEFARPEIQAFCPEVAFHLAWTGGNSSRHANQPEQVFANVPGSLKLANILADVGCKVLIYAGSSLEYGSFQIPAKETDLPLPSNLYGATKYGTEILLQGLSAVYGMRFCGTRVFWTYGPKDDDSRMIPSVVMALLAGQRPSLTMGLQLWDFLYIDDATEALLLLANAENANGIFNLGSGTPVTVRHAVELIQRCIDPSLKVAFGAIPYGPNQVMHLEADVSRLKVATGWDPRISLEEGIRKTVDWYKTKAGYAK